MSKRLLIYFIILSLIPVAVKGQEVVIGLQSNKQLSGEKDKSAVRPIAKGAALELPFFDDFSGHSPSTNSKYWLDNYVFINNTFSQQQITKGVASFDALDNAGVLYENLSPTGFMADHLTSNPINLNYLPADNIWLSFYYEPGGLSDMPEARDSLTLQFFAPGENKWYSVWRALGGLSTKFKPVIIKIDKTRFLKSGFQFRFINYASITSSQNDPSMIGNCDIWNIDYVMLDKNRNEGDTINADVAFRLPLRSLLKNYEAMPWNQFNQVYLQEMGSSIPVNYRNNDTITRNVTRFFEIRDVYKNELSHFFSGGATNVPPQANISYNANLVYTYNSSNTDSALFRVTCTLKTDEFDVKENDTLVYNQKFANYFAFDDGSAEAGYGINGLGSRNAMLAYRFRSYIQDTLRAIQICFNDSYMNANKRAFDLMVWGDNNGVPGDVLYTVEEVMVEKIGGVNSFYTYRLPDGVPVNNIFYIGWRQRSETFLNAGFDFNTPNKGRQFYWLNGNWIQSQVDGSVMIRPIVGKRIRTTSVDDFRFPDKNLIKIWPNPAYDVLNISSNEPIISELSYITITDLNGREVMNVRYSEQLNISALPRGIYIVISNINGKNAGYNRLIITR